MIVRFRRRSLYWASLILAELPAVDAAIKWVDVVDKKQHDGTGPYVAWHVLREELIARHITVRHSSKRQRTPAAVVSAIRAITTEQNAILRHPALRKKAMIGTHGGWFPVWELDEPDMTVPGGRFYSPLPIDGARFVVLGPQWSGTYDRQVTTWSPSGAYPVEDRLAVEATHLAVHRI